MSCSRDILIIGSVAFDSLHTPFGKRDAVLGGSATFSSIAASFFNKDISIVSVVGKDFPKKYVSVFKKRKINVEGMEIADGKTFKWKGDYNYDLSAPKTIYTHLNVFASFNPVVPKSSRNSKCVFLANIDPDLQEKVLSQIKGPDLVLCDTMNYWIERKRRSLIKLLKKVDMFLLNEGEARQLSGETNLKKAARFIISCGTPAVIIKKSEHGVLYFSKHFSFVAPAYPIDEIIDPTGAGDTFAGGMLGFLSSAPRFNSTAIKKSIIHGTIMASFAVEDFSVNGLLKVSGRDVKKRYKHLKDITAF